MDESVLEIFNEVKESAVGYLSQLGNYDIILRDASFRGGQNRWMAKLIRHGNDTGNPVIAINTPKIRQWVDNLPENYDKEEAFRDQVIISVFHEIGHFIMDVLRENYESGDADFFEENKKDWKYLSRNEEEVVEQFGRYMAEIDSYSWLNDFLMDFLDSQNSVNENKKMKKNIIISEDQSKTLAKILKEETYQMPVPKETGKPYCINPDKVLIVKNYLDKNFQKMAAEFKGDNGFRTKKRYALMLSSAGTPMDEKDYIFDETLLDMLTERFKNMFSNHEERGLFLTQVMNDWFDNKIGLFGNLSVNSLK